VRLPRLYAVVSLALPVALLTACGSAADSGPLASVQVDGKFGAKPAVKVSAPLTLDSSSTRVLTEGSGAKVTAGQKVTADYLLVNGRDGKELDTSFGKEPVTFTADPTQIMPGLAKGLTGQKVGSRVLIGVPPKDAFGETGNPQLGVGKNDTLLFVLDVKASRTPLAKAAGKAVAPKAGLPTVSVDAAGKPTIKIPATKAPSALVTQPLVKGAGPVVKSGSTITVHYTGVVWDGGKAFDSSFKTGKPASFPIGVGQVIPGWDKGLVGQTVGSRVLLSIPPAGGYGAAGQPAAGIKGTDTLVFVVDILEAG
jgi:peptidylprolyl isomerase